TPGVSRKDEVAVRKPDGSKPPQNPKAAGTKKGLKTANLEAAGKNQAVRVERPLRPAADSGIIADIEPLTGLGEFSGKPAARQEPKWYELAPQIRDALPNLSVSMLIYSKKPEDRWININGSKKREGEEISAGLKLEEITPDGAIFSYQGHRFYKGVVGD
ncbi:MAG TPA: general secretion pathway protein GspB, partial [Syntrophobacteraceae bacterium]|nr:general secretion pathway protein GspB [Syntrophobacteraceae bacterium]